MTYETTTHKDYSGAWRAKSTATLIETPEGTRKLELTTSKVYGGIAATPCNRVTEKAVKEVHSRALLEMAAIIAEAKAFYEKHDAEKVA